MFKIDKDRFERDFLYTFCVLNKNPSYDFVKSNYDSFWTFNSIYFAFFYKYIDFSNPNTFRDADILRDKMGTKNFKSYIDKVKKNIVPIINCASSTYDLMDKMDFYDYPYFDVVRKYSEADFKDLILGYYSTYGNDYYKIIKKYFDENRIQCGFNDPICKAIIEADDKEEETIVYVNTKQLYDGKTKVKDLLEKVTLYYGEENNELQEEVSDDTINDDINDDSVTFNSRTEAFFSFFHWLDSGYIVNYTNKYDSSSAEKLIHELAHAVDAERFIFPQKKKGIFFDDIFCEIPSYTMQYGFYDYLKNNHIDIDGSRILRNASYDNLWFFSTMLIYIINNPDFNIGYNGGVYDKNNNYTNLRNAVIYSIGHYMALHLNLIRESSNEEFLKAYNDVMTLRRELTYKQIIEMLGFDYQKFMEGYYINNKIESDYLELKKRYGQ